MHEDTPARAPRRPADGERDPLVGRLLDGRYRVGPRIARGGMASVYEAHDIRLDRTVAVKIMHAGLGDATSGDEAFAMRFVREARAAARLSHPNVVAVYDQGGDHAADGTVYLVMELVTGHTLRDTITKEAPMSPERALAMLDPVLSALASAHRTGLVHRDVKPENVLIADDGRIKVADFGLAKAVSAETQHTATQGVLIGTVSYLAPELVTDGKADARADVYAVGVMLYELLTGTKPHTGETPIQVAYRHVHHDVPAPSATVPSLPAYVDALVARATCRDRSLRPADAAVLLHHVRRVQGALHEGVREDPELFADLMPVGAHAGADMTGSEVTDDTTPEPMDVRWIEEPVRPHTTALEVQARPPAPERDRPAPPPPPQAAPGRPRRGRRPLVLLLLGVLVAAAIGGGAYWYGWARYTTTPSVLGLEKTAAETELADAGLSVEYGDAAYSESVPKGEVISSEPGAGERILPDDVVTLVLSLGPERYDVPKLEGTTLDEAEAALADVQFVVGKVSEKWSETVPEGQVISSDPGFGTKAGKRLPVDTVVDLVVSKGRQPIKVKDFTGKDSDKAIDELESRGLDVEVVDEEYSDDVDEGDVISQDPADGRLYKGDKVELVVSLGPELIEVPRVFFESTDDAVAMLEDAGFEVDVERAQIYFDGSRAYSTNPPAGEMVPKGSTITLYVV
ncbi:serine/threonine-protein kinase [Nocardioides thalensis]|uniref:non-specific serine/threonine protein kinase n=1 Tax=Nocardioides thalensis TaxID=1914755 RepID=A0A853C424_9ACTN|nr:serine/threonine-protein kinase [Nocardioides thalensis]